MSDGLPPELRPNASDHAATALRATLTNIPGIGGFVGEMINFVIPNQRLDRFAEYVARLEARLERLDRKLKAGAIGPEGIALFEDGALGAATATADERISHLSRLVAEGLFGNEKEAEEQRAIVRLLNDLSEGDLRYLMLWTKRYGDDREWRKSHGFDYRWEQRNGESVSVGDGAMDSVVEFSRQGRLISMGLMEMQVLAPTADQERYALETDVDISHRGIDFLRRLGLLSSTEK